MPVGTEAFAGGRTRSRSWAPAARHVNLLLANLETRRETEMAALDDGWFEVDAVDAPAGTRHTFRVDGTPGDGSRLHLIANFGSRPHRTPQPPGELIYASHPEHARAGERLLLLCSMLCILAKRS
jgi:1,4-alpha-glucan branching enzyme